MAWDNINYSGLGLSFLFKLSVLDCRGVNIGWNSFAVFSKNKLRMNISFTILLFCNQYLTTNKCCYVYNYENISRQSIIIGRVAWSCKVMFWFVSDIFCCSINITWLIITKLFELYIVLYSISIRALQHSIRNFYREFPQLRCTELQLQMRLAGLHLQLKRVAHEQNTRLAVSSWV